MRRNTRIQITQQDLKRLRAILTSRGEFLGDREHLLDLQDELEQARVVSEDEIATDVIRLQSQVRVRDRETGVTSTYIVVGPAQADVSVGHISVVAPLGTALLGYREGDEVEWQMPGGVRQLQIVEVRQPLRLDPQPSHGHAAA